MKHLTSKKVIILPGVLVLVIVVSLLAFLALTTQANHKQTVQAQMSTQVQRPGRITSDFPISRNVPAFASSGYTPASRANDASYDTAWRSQGFHAWLAYNLSSVPLSQRGKVLVVWYNETFNYDHTIITNNAYNMPENYTIDVNPDSGRGDPPDSGWVTLVTVKENHYHSRQHLIDMTGNNWIRINVTAVDGSLENFDTAINMDVYNASPGISDDWIFFGDSITAGAMGHVTMGGVNSFAQLINAQSPDNFPVQES